MKEKIKKWLKEWFTSYTVMAVAFLALAVASARIGEYQESLCCLAIVLFCISTAIKNKRIELMEDIVVSYAKECDIYKQGLYDIEDSAIYYHLKWLLAQNDVRLCKKQISVGKYLERRKVLESKIEKMEKKIELRKKK